MQTISTNRVIIPDGEYTGKIGGHEVIADGFECYPISVSTGVRGMNIRCTIEVKNGKALVKI